MHEDGNNFHKLWITTSGNLIVEIRYQKLKLNFNYCFRDSIFQNQIHILETQCMSLRDLLSTNIDRLDRICGNLLGKKALAKEKYTNDLNSVLFINVTKDLQYYIRPRYASDAIFLWIRSPREIYSTIFYLKHIKTSVSMMRIRTARMKG